jgi:hypothetical protein
VHKFVDIKWTSASRFPREEFHQDKEPVWVGLPLTAEGQIRLSIEFTVYRTPDQYYKVVVAYQGMEHVGCIVFSTAGGAQERCKEFLQDAIFELPDDSHIAAAVNVDWAILDVARNGMD